jgi:hypothetical protein
VTLAGVAAAALIGGMTLAAAPAVFASRAPATVTTHIEICKVGSVTGTYEFSVDGAAPIGVEANGPCASVDVSAGSHTVAELPDTTGKTVLTKIRVIPSTAGTGDVATRTATVTVAAGNTVETRFKDEPAKGELKVCKVADASSANLTGYPFNFTANAGSFTDSFTVPAAAPGDTYGSCDDLGSFQVGTSVNIAEAPVPSVQVSSITALNGTLSDTSYSGGTTTVTLTGGVTEVAYTNANSVPIVNGYLEICKIAGDSYVPIGPWTFTVTNSTGQTVDQEQVLAGQCNEVLNGAGLPLGNYTVTESVGFPYYVSAISAYPTSDLLSSNLNDATATFAVEPNLTTTAYFTNDTHMGQVKVCKSLASNAEGLSGQTFKFKVSDAAGTQSVDVSAQFGETPCSIDSTPLPAGSTATITEAATPNTAISGVAVSPPSAGTTTSSSATVTVSPTNLNAAIFTNEALGWVEVCKDAGDASVTGSFAFSVNDTPINPVAVGGCSQAIQVPAGTATIDETESNPDYYVSDTAAQGFNGTTFVNQLVSVPGANPAEVTVPYGGVGDETVVTYTNSTVTGVFKICTAQTSTDAALTGDTFTYSWSYTVNGTSSSGSVPLVVPATGSQCSGEIGLPGIPLINSNGSPVTVSVTAQAPSLVGVDLASFGYQGFGSVVPPAPVTPGPLPQTATIDLGGGLNIETFTNGATH